MPPRKNEPSLDNVKLALEEMRELYRTRLESADALDRKAGQLLGSASLVLSLVTTLQLTLLRREQPCYYWVGLGLSFLLYLGLVGISLKALSPTTYETPLKAEWKVIKERVLDASPRDALQALVKANMDSSVDNKKVLDLKATRVRIGMVLLGLIVVLMTTLSLVASR